MPTISVHGKMPSRAEARKYEEARKYQEELASSQRSTAHGEDRSKSGYLSELRSILVMEDRGHKEYLEGLRQHVKDMKALQSKGGMPFGSQGAAAFSNQVRAASAAAFGVRGRKGGGTSYPSSRITREGYDARIFGTPIERYHAGDVELSARQRRQQAEAENRDFDRRMKARRGFEAQRKREEDARYRKDRAEAEHKNNDMKLIARKQESERQKDARFAAKLRGEEQRTERAGETWIAARKAAARSAMFGTPEERYGANEENARRDRMSNRPGFVGKMALGAARFVGGRYTEGALGHLIGYGGGRGRGGGGGIGYRGGMGIGMNEFGELGTAGMLGAGAVVALGAYEVAKKVVTFPSMYANKLNAIAGVAQPYWNLRQSGANIGRAGGFNGRDLVGRFFPGDHGGHTTPGWMQRTGATPEAAMQAVRAYGLPIGSAAQGEGVAKLAFEASMSPYLGGMAPDRYAQSMGQYKTLGGQGSNENYLNELQRTMGGATKLGLDHSRVLNNIEDLMRAQVSLGYTRPDIGATSASWFRMAASGAPSARTGEMQLSVLQNTAQAAAGAGFGGNAAVNVMLHTAFSKGGLPKTRDALANKLGIKYKDLDDAHKLLFDRALNASVAGDEASMYTLLQPFLTPDTMGRLANSSGLVPQYGAMRSLLLQAYTGLTPLQSAANDAGVGKQLPQTLSMSTQQRAIALMARFRKDYPGLTQDQAAGMVSVISGENSDLLPHNEKNPPPGSRGGIGTDQWTGARRDRLEQWAKDNGRDINDPSVDMDFQKWELAKYYPNIMKNVMGQSTSAGAAAAFSPYIANPHHLDYSGRARALAKVGGNELEFNPYMAMTGQANVEPGKQASDFGVLLSKTVMTALGNFSGKIEGASASVDKFVSSLNSAISDLTGNDPSHATEYRNAREHRNAPIHHLDPPGPPPNRWRGHITPAVRP